MAILTVAMLAAATVVVDEPEGLDAPGDFPAGSGNAIPVLGSSNFCNSGGCKLGEGDCDIGECAATLGCGLNNCRAMNPGMDHVFPSSADCCEPLRPFHYEWCEGKKCGFAEGDCDRSVVECADGLICGRNNCRDMNPGVSESLIPSGADCCTTCASVTSVKSGGPIISAPLKFANGKVVATERTLANPPTMLETSNVHSLPALVSGDKIKLECCASKGEPCNFFVAVYHCPPCSRGKNGGIPGFLLSQSWRGSSCAPIFTPAGSSQTQTMTVFHKTLQAGETLDIPVSTDAPHVAVFSTSQNVEDDWCPVKNNVKPGTTGPNSPCVCL
eukprot:TRINITY_DN273_c0_g2_i5.p1 TRINITY_DN273_c0_g2~~TRINITY_DN273_c0_g2_i5.p1  ORF type:complete len:353 (+),score=96.12 TRINITY_DN273_c0_g2_i5:75-1061(+)